MGTPTFGENHDFVLGNALLDLLWIRHLSRLFLVSAALALSLTTVPPLSLLDITQTIVCQDVTTLEDVLLGIR